MTQVMDLNRQLRGSCLVADKTAAQEAETNARAGILSWSAYGREPVRPLAAKAHTTPPACGTLAALGISRCTASYHCEA